jgi:hypothetical protein
MRIIRPLAFAALFLGAQIFSGPSAKAQAFPPGSYQGSCTQVHWAGSTLVAECRTRDGRMTGTGLANARGCRGDIANIDGQLRCVSGGPPPAAAPVPPAAPGYPPPSGYGQPPGPGYQPPGYSGPEDIRARCEELWHREHELRERLEYTPWGPDRDELEYRLQETHERRERFGCER